MPYCQIYDNGRRKNCQVVYQHRNRCDEKCDGVIAGSSIFEIFNFLFGFAFFKAGGTKMLVVDGNITKGTHETAAGGTRNHRFFAGVIEATGLFVHLHQFAGMTGWQSAVQRRVDIRAYKPLAFRTGDHRISIEHLRW